MKTQLYRLFLLSIIMTISLQSCIRTIEINEDGAPSGAIIRVATPVRSNQTTTFSIDVHVVNASGNFVNSLGPQNFSIKDTSSNPRGMTFKLLDVKGGGKTDFKGDYSAFLLLDQSGSTDATDPDNLRIQASQIFMDAMGNNDKVALGSFTTGYNYSSYNGYTYLHGGFTNNGQSFYSSLDSLATIISKGNTPLFCSTQWAINYTATKAPNKNKVVVVFTDGVDNYGSSQATTTALSIQKNVPIFTVGLSNDVNFSVLNNMALSSGGTFMWAKDAKQLISYFGTLGNLLHGNANYYTLTFQATTSSSFQNIDRVLFLQVKLSNGKTFLMPYVVSLYHSSTA